MKRHPRHIGYAMMLASALLAGCVEDNGYCQDPGRDTSGAIADDLQEITLDIDSRATEYSGDVLDNELIHSYWVVFIDRNGSGKIVASAEATLSNPTDKTRLKVEVPNGTFRVYAFANISKAAVCASLGIPDYSFNVGRTAPDEYDMDNARIRVADNNRSLETGWSVDANIPMSGKTYYTVNKQTYQSYTVSVTRMLSKIEYEFKGRSSARLNIKSLTISSISKGGIPLFGFSTETLFNPNFTPSGAADYTHSLPQSGTLSMIPANDTNKTVSGHFYVPESRAAQTTDGNRFILGIRYARDGKADDTDYTVTYELTNFPRNYLIRLPIVITDYRITVDPMVDAPIGGYAPEVEKVNERESYVSYIGASKGKFRVNAYNVETGAKLRPSAYTLTFESGNTASIFDEQPTFDTASGLIRFTLKDRTGSADVRIKITVKATNQSYIRLIHIKNTKE